MTAGTAGPTAQSRPHAEEGDFVRLRTELSERIENECAHVNAVLSERIAGVRELLDQRINDQTRLLRADFRSLEARLVHETGSLRTEISAAKDGTEARLVHETGSLRTEISAAKDGTEARLVHETESLRTEISAVKDGTEARLAHETKALRSEIKGLKDLLLGRLEQQERVRAAEYAATKWSIRSMMAAMALLVAMMARFTLLQ